VKIRRSPDRDERPARVVSIPVVTGLLGAAVVVLAVLTVLVGTSVWRADAKEDERARASQSARQTAVNLASLDHRDIQKGLDRVLSGLTGEAKDQWATMAKDVRQSAQKAQSTSTVQEVRAGVVSMDGDSAEVIVAITAVTTSPSVKQGQPRYYRWRFDLNREDGRWLVSNMRLVA
jgi:Mce-associated membrane protein